MLLETNPLTYCSITALSDETMTLECSGWVTWDLRRLTTSQVDEILARQMRLRPRSYFNPDAGPIILEHSQDGDH